MTDDDRDYREVMRERTEAKNEASARRGRWLFAGIVVIALVVGAWTAIDSALNKPHCVRVTNPELLDSLSVKEAWAWRADNTDFYIADANAAVWTTHKFSPTGVGSGGLYALNDEARSTTEIGSEAPIGVFGRGPDDAGADHAYDCATEH